MQNASSKFFPALSPHLTFSPLARFKNSKFNSDQDLATFSERFDTGLKGTFKDNSKNQFVKFGSSRDNDDRCGVKGGKMSLLGWVASSHVPGV